MADNLKIRQPLDATKINIHEEWELEYWSKKLGVTRAALVQAVKTVGVSAAAVRKHLGI